MEETKNPETTVEVVDIQFRPGHFRRLGLHFQGSDPTPISLTLQNSVLAGHTLFTPS